MKNVLVIKWLSAGAFHLWTLRTAWLGSAHFACGFNKQLLY
jgi:hypothetical protein